RPGEADAESGQVVVGEVLEVVVHEHHEEIRAGGVEPAARLAEARVETVSLLGLRDLRLPRDERCVRGQCRPDDLCHVRAMVVHPRPLEKALGQFASPYFVASGPASPQRTPTYASGCRPARASSGSQLAPVPVTKQTDYG